MCALFCSISAGLYAGSFTFLLHVALTFAVMNREGKNFHCSLKSWQERSWFPFLQKPQKHYVKFSFLSFLDCSNSQTCSEPSHFYRSGRDDKNLALVSLHANEFHLGSSMNEERLILNTLATLSCIVKTILILCCSI